MVKLSSCSARSCTLILEISGNSDFNVFSAGNPGVKVPKLVHEWSRVRVSVSIRVRLVNPNHKRNYFHP